LTPVADSVVGGVVANCVHIIPEEQPADQVKRLNSFLGEASL
jgi:hypothetical protein